MKDICIYKPGPQDVLLTRPRTRSTNYAVKGGIHAARSGHPLQIRMSEPDHYYIRKAAQKCGCTVSAFCRDVIMQVAEAINEEDNK